MQSLQNGSQSGVQQTNSCTLYVGNLHTCIDEVTLLQAFQSCGPVESAKIIKDKTSGTSQGYGFVRFTQKHSAEIAIQQFQGYSLYGQEIRINWAYPSGQREDVSLHHHIFVGDLSQEVTDTTLMAAFSRFMSCSGARVLWDTNTGRSKGYGFVSFRNKDEAEYAIQEVNGQILGGRRIRCGWAQHKQTNLEPQDYMSISRQDPNNSNVYIGNVSPELNEEDIKLHFQRFGEVAEIKSHKKGGYGFVRFKRHEDAAQAIVAMNGITINSKILKCSWGKKTNNASNSALHGFGANTTNAATVSLMSPINVNQMLQAYPVGLSSSHNLNHQVIMGATGVANSPNPHSLLPPAMHSHITHPSAGGLSQHLMLPQQLRGSGMGGNGRGMIIQNTGTAGRLIGLQSQYDAWMG
eukprot:TRINITY_DN1591_c0_g2_i7.p1 TRINITY_DN1591_c0_g2~~TRINITY_DN1591_c0_g2_i7.p1  ORF type:complete len:408 (-),score=39.14 TRINITY_DN1591_c0_g2_i7:1927-3150(-)